MLDFRESVTAIKLLTRWHTLYKSARGRQDPDIIKLATETDAFLYPVPVPRPIERPQVTQVGNLNDLLEYTCGETETK